jgi:hypothetical protein
VARGTCVEGVTQKFRLSRGLFPLCTISPLRCGAVVLTEFSLLHACRYLLIFSGQSLPTVVKIQQRKIKSSQ